MQGHEAKLTAVLHCQSLSVECSIEWPRPNLEVNLDCSRLFSIKATAQGANVVLSTHFPIPPSTAVRKRQVIVEFATRTCPLI